jgi:hypothetical protein
MLYETSRPALSEIKPPTRLPHGRCFRSDINAQVAAANAIKTTATLMLASHSGGSSRSSMSREPGDESMEVAWEEKKIGH